MKTFAPCENGRPRGRDARHYTRGRDARRYTILLFLLLTSSFFLAVPASAALFDTFDQTVLRYGWPVQAIAPTKPANYAAIFEKGGYRVTVQFVDRRALQIRYERLDHMALGEDEIETLLRANQEALAPWRERSKTTHVWTRTDNRAEARVEMGKIPRLMRPGKGSPSSQRSSIFEIIATDFKTAVAAIPPADVTSARRLEKMMVVPPAETKAPLIPQEEPKKKKHTHVIIR
jgi:hypothetical protein